MIICCDRGTQCLYGARSHVGQLNRARKASMRSSSVSGCRRTADCIFLRLKKSGAMYRQVSQSAADSREADLVVKAGHVKAARRADDLKAGDT